MMLHLQILFIKKGKVELMGAPRIKMLFTIHSIYDLYNSVLLLVYADDEEALDGIRSHC